MAKFRFVKNSFLGGMVSPTALSRTDLPQYSHSCEILQNMMPMLSGGAYRRPGTLGVDAWSVGSGINGPARTIPFVVARTEPYCIVLGNNTDGNGTVTVYRAIGNFTGQIQKEDATGTHPYARQKLTYPYPVYPDDEIFNVQYCQSVDTMYLVHPNHPPQIMSRIALDSFTFAQFDYLLSLNFASSSTEANGQLWANSYPYLNQNFSPTTMKVSSAAIGTGVTLTASTPYFSNNGGLNGTGHVGSIFRIDDGSSAVGAIMITAVGGTAGTLQATATGQVITTFGDTNTHLTWWESAWSNMRGWPSSCCIFQQRLIFGGTSHQPDTLWHSNTAGYSTFSVLGSDNLYPVLLASQASTDTPTAAGAAYIHYPDDSSGGDGVVTGPTGAQPFRITLSQNQLDQIQWLSPDKELLIGTQSQEWLASPQNGSYDVNNSPIVIQSKYGSDFIPAVRIGYELIFNMFSQSEVRAYQYNYIDASFFAEPVQLFFDQYPQPENGSAYSGRRKVRQMDWDVTRQTLWSIDTAGNLYGMTRDRKLNTTTWHTHQLGGYNPGNGVGVGTTGGYTDPAYWFCDGGVASFAVVPNPTIGINDIWMIVKRTISGVTEWQLERMIGANVVRNSVLDEIFPGEAGQEPCLVDSAVTLSDSGSASNLTYAVGFQLNGYSLVGTYYSPTYGMYALTTGVVSGGNATITSGVPPDYGTGTNVLTLGLPIATIIKPVRLDAGSQLGTAQSALKGFGDMFIRFFKTLSAYVGSAPNGQDESALQQLNFNLNPNLPMGQSNELYTGDIRVVGGPTTYDRDGYIYLANSDPLPYSVIGIVIEGETYE